MIIAYYRQNKLLVSSLMVILLTKLNRQRITSNNDKSCNEGLILSVISSLVKISLIILSILYLIFFKKKKKEKRIKIKKIKFYY
jgi:hypothetical protein